MRRLLPVLLGVLLAVAGLTAFAWQRAGDDRYGGLAEQARALAEVLRGAAEESATAVAAAEENLAGRLAAAARRADVEIARLARPAAETLQRVASEERVGRLVLLDAAGHVVAVARHPPAVAVDGPTMVPRERLEEIEREEFAQAARRLAPPAGGVAREGLQVNAFGTRERFGLAYGRSEGGTLLLRADAGEVAELRSRFGIGPVLTRTVRMPGIRSAALLDGAGAIVLDGAGREPGTPTGHRALPEHATDLDGAGGLRATAEVRLPEAPPLVAEVVLSTARADEAVARSRRAILLAAGLAGLLAAALAAALVLRETRHRRTSALAEARREEEGRLAEMGALAGLVTHELANPLNAVRLGLSVLDDLPDEAARAPVVASVKEEAARMGQTLETYLGLARSEGRQRDRVGPEVLDRVTSRVAAQAEARQVRVRVEARDAMAAVRGDPVVLEQAFTNLARNAVGAAPADGTVTLAWERAEGGGVRVTVSDPGPGFPAEGRDALLRLGGSTRPGGHGLGLALAQRFLRLHGGRLALEDAPGGGARVVAWLPADADPAPEGGARG